MRLPLPTARSRAPSLGLDPPVSSAVPSPHRSASKRDFAEDDGHFEGEQAAAGPPTGMGGSECRDSELRLQAVLEAESEAAAHQSEVRRVALHPRQLAIS